MTSGKDKTKAFSLVWVCLFSSLVSRFYQRGMCQSAQAPLQQGLKIRSSHLPSFAESAHTLFSMSANPHAHRSDDTSSPPDMSSSWRKTSRCFLSETSRGSQNTYPASLHRQFPEVTSLLLLRNLIHLCSFAEVWLCRLRSAISCVDKTEITSLQTDYNS